MVFNFFVINFTTITHLMCNGVATYNIQLRALSCRLVVRYDWRAISESPSDFKDKYSVYRILSKKIQVLEANKAYLIYI